MNDKILVIVYLLGVLLLILPGFMSKNKNLKVFSKNIAIWLVIVLAVIFLLKTLGKIW